jgi:hypothetical protein
VLFRQFFQFLEHVVYFSIEVRSQFFVEQFHAARLCVADASAVCKINIDSDSRLAMTAAIRKVFAEKPAEFDPRKYLGPARDNMKKLYIHKIVNVLGSAGKLAE